MTVTDVIEKDNIIYHIIDNDTGITGEVSCRIEWDRRFDYMQQHTGQHILSQALIIALNAPTVSSSLGRESSTIDVDKDSFCLEEAEMAEKLANDWIYKNVPLNILYPTREEMDAMPLRKKPPEGKKSRIINIEGLDYSPCGGTHCARTGEVGVIKIRKWEKMRGNIRIEFYCGQRALSDYIAKSKQVTTVSSLLSSHEHEIEEAVSRLLAENKSINKLNNEIREQVFEYQSREIFSDAELFKDFRIIRHIIEAATMPQLQLLAQKIRSHGECAVLLGSSGDKPSFVFTCTEKIDIDLSGILNELRSQYPVKGGGSKTMVQGGLNGEASISDFIDKTIQSIKSSCQ
jgi:alanyl-tRNA synthetase